MRLLVFIGAGTPTYPLYNQVYRLIESEALRYGYSSVDWSTRWKGQGGGWKKSRDSLNLSDAISTGRDIIHKYDSDGQDYHILGRSFGALVAACCVSPEKPRHLRKLILWGPPVYWLMWKKFVRDFEHSRKYNLSKGVHINAEYFSSLIPFESVLSDIRCRTVIATGSKDTYCSPEYLTYLESVSRCNKKLVFRVVKDAPHEVTRSSSTQVIEDYLAALFER
jgi:hypothetical protein